MGIPHTEDWVSDLRTGPTFFVSIPSCTPSIPLVATRGANSPVLPRALAPSLVSEKRELGEPGSLEYKFCGPVPLCQVEPEDVGGACVDDATVRLRLETSSVPGVAPSHVPRVRSSHWSSSTSTTTKTSTCVFAGGPWYSRRVRERTFQCMQGPLGQGAMGGQQESQQLEACQGRWAWPTGQEHPGITIAVKTTGQPPLETAGGSREHLCL